MATALNNTQLEILKLFSEEQSEQESREIKSLLIAYLADRVTREADQAFDEKGYAKEIFSSWKAEHFRSASNR